MRKAEAGGPQRKVTPPKCGPKRKLTMLRHLVIDGAVPKARIGYALFIGVNIHSCGSVAKAVAGDTTEMLPQAKADDAKALGDSWYGP